jgi:hypothetical protein
MVVGEDDLRGLSVDRREIEFKPAIHLRQLPLALNPLGVRSRVATRGQDTKEYRYGKMTPHALPPLPEREVQQRRQRGKTS